LQLLRSEIRTKYLGTEAKPLSAALKAFCQLFGGIGCQRAARRLDVEGYNAAVMVDAAEASRGDASRAGNRLSRYAMGESHDVHKVTMTVF
jgi:hypothetical protein